MKGKAPPIIEQLEWLRRNFLKYLLHIALILSVLLNWYLYNSFQDLKRASAIEIFQLNDRLVDYRGCRTQSPHGDPPLFVTFSDGQSAFVNFFHLQTPAEESDFMSPEYQATYLQRGLLVMNGLKSAVFSELEVVSFDNARENRDELAVKVVQRLQPLLSEMEMEIFKFYFHEFCRVE